MVAAATPARDIRHIAFDDFINGVAFLDLP